ncbi:MAG: hypothetical protein ABSA18_16120 [Dehalococcoidia bacterium]
MKSLMIHAISAAAITLIVLAFTANASPVSAEASDNASAIYLQNWGQCGCKAPQASTAVSENTGTIYLRNWGHISRTTVPISAVVSDNASILYLQNWAHNGGRPCPSCLPNN